MMADATDIAVLCQSATHFVSLAKRSVITKMKRLPDLDGDTGPKMSTDRSVKGSLTGNNVKGGVCRRNVRRFCAHVVHLVMVAKMSDIIDGRVILTAHRIIQTVYARVGGHSGMVLEKEDSFTQRLWHNQLVAVRRPPIQRMTFVCEKRLGRPVGHAFGHVNAKGILLLVFDNVVERDGFRRVGIRAPPRLQAIGRLGQCKARCIGTYV